MRTNNIDTEIMLNEIFMTVPDCRVTDRCTYALSDLLTIHGRIEIRDCRILNADTIGDKEVKNRWPGLRTPVEITSTVDYGDHIATTVRRYISDENFPKAAYFNMLARGHRAIENQLHRNLDVNFLEDACRAGKGFAAVNLSTIRKLALQIIKEHIDKINLKKRRFKASLSNDYLKDMMLNAKF